MIGQKLGAYQITEEIGEGGMATVYRAHQSSMDRHVAVKLIRGNFLHDATLRDRFRREGRLIARLEHPHLLPVYDFDGDHTPPYIVMRYLEGGTLKQVLRKAKVPHGEVIYMLRQVAAALDYAHRQGVVHRDLKPSNIMIDKEGNAFVTDFGIARVSDAGEDLTGTGMLIGTPTYMSPEQAKGAADVDKASDLYSLGVMVFEMLTGRPPYVHEGNMGVLMSHINDPVPDACEGNSHLPPAVGKILKRAMAKNREERQSSAHVLIEELASALQVETASSPAHLRDLTETLSVDQLESFARQKASTEEPSTGSNATPSDQQRQMTAVYVDATEMAEALYAADVDQEVVRERMDGIWETFKKITESAGGVVQSRTDDQGVLLWGRARASEDDPELAIRATLQMREAVLAACHKSFGRSWEPSEENPLPFAAGIATGPLLIERQAETGSYSVRGVTITLANRLKDAAEPGEILASHDSFTFVRGVFQFKAHEPIRIRGRKEPLEVYEVQRDKPRAFRMKARGIEGVETKMIGREIELRLVQEALTLTLEDGETQVVTVVGEAGVGKSRLLFEFRNWMELVDETVWFFQARATKPSMLQPYSLTRDLFSFRFEILDSDPLDTVYEKFIKGSEQFLGPNSGDRAELIGQLVGFDFASKPRVAAALEDPESFRATALAHLGEFFAAAAEQYPIAVHIEDIHWADDASLDLINHLVREQNDLPLFVLCMARPSLYDRRPQWGEGQRFHERVQLDPLSQLSSRRLVKELLKKLPKVPPQLRDLVVDRADGNPFYIEELIKALIGDGVIIKGEENWSVDESRLSSVKVPQSLTGVLQARLDTLPPGQHQMLQRASVVGRIFWDSAAVFLSQEAGLDHDEVMAMLEDLREREMILRREESGFAGTTEYVFRHAILRDVTYETIVPRHRRQFHKQVAHWLLETGGERASEHTVLVAEHFSQAGEPVFAAEQMQLAAKTASNQGALDEARTILRRAKELASQSEDVNLQLLIEAAIGQLFAREDKLQEARDYLEPLVDQAREANAETALAKVLGFLGRISLWLDDGEKAQFYLTEAEPLARKLDDRAGLMFILRQVGNLCVSGDYEKGMKYLRESLEIGEELGDLGSQSQALNSMGVLSMEAKKFDFAAEVFNKGLAMTRTTGNKVMEAMCQSNLAEAYGRLGKVDEAIPECKQALKVAVEGKTKSMEGASLEMLGWLHILKGDNDKARKYLVKSLELYEELDREAPFTLVFVSVLFARAGRQERALELAGMLRNQDTLFASAMELDLGQFEPEMREGLAPEAVKAAVERGRSLNLKEEQAKCLESLKA